MPRLAHQVFFTLKNRDDASIEKLLDACQEYLTGHEGAVEFAIGKREPRYDRPVNLDFDVALHVVFADEAAHDQYQVAPRHLTFIERNKETWASVQIFDSNLRD